MKITSFGSFAVTACLALMLCLCGELWAAPYAGDILELEQPDGTLVEVRFWGDEYYVRGESLDGYTVVRDPATGWIVYADLNEDASAFIPTDVVYDSRYSTDPEHPSFTSRQSGQQRAGEKGQSHARGLQQQLRQRQDVVEAKHLRRRMELHPERFMEAADDGMTEVYSAASAMAPAPVTGSVVGLTILVEFPDVRGTISATEIERYCNEPGYTGYGNKGSVRDYFLDVSNGLLDYTNVVTNYVMLNNNKSYYDSCGGWGKTGELIDEALNKLCAQGFDFSSLTRRSNGRVMALNIFYAGSPSCGWSEGLWPHMSSRNVTICGTSFGTYQITNIGNSLRLGTFCHENGHMVCGYPDLYDYTSSSNGVGSFCLMSYSGPNDNPVPPCSYLRWTTGWETITNITNDPSGTLRTHTANTNTSFRYSHPTNSKEYFLIESRLKTGRNSGLPAEGLLIWRINEDGNNAYPTAHPTHPYRKSFRVALEQADGQFHLERRNGYGDSNDAFRSGYRDKFDDFTSPDAVWWDESFSGLSISHIGPVGSQVSFTVGGGFVPAAHYQLDNNFSDASGNGYHGSGYNFPSNQSHWLGTSFDGSYDNLGGSLRFDGVNDYVELPSAVGAGAEIGIAFWMKPDEAADMIPLDKHPADSTGAGWSVRLRADGRIVFRVGSNSNAVAVATRGPAYEAGRWAHVACSYKGGTVRIFVNGRLRALQHGLSVTPSVSNIPVRMGIAAQANTDWVYKGVLDDVRFYTEELTDNRLRAISGLNLKPGKGLMLYLPLDEKSGVEAIDKSGDAKHGELKNGMSFASDSVEGIVGGALQFDGTDDHIQIPGGFGKMHDGFTVALWAYPTAVKNWARFFDFGNGNAAGNILLARMGNTNDLVFEVYNGGTSGGRATAAGAIELHKWQHFAVTVNANGSAVVYKNGQAVATGTTGTALNVHRINNYIGRSNWTADAYYQGSMDEIRMYNYSLSSAEIHAVYQSRRIDGPSPVNGTDDINPNTMLTWNAPVNTAWHDVYFGPNAEAVAAATEASPEYCGRRHNAQYKPAGLDPWRDYYWRVDTLLRDGTVVTGPVWSFSTVGGVIREVWTDISGNALTNLINHPGYPDQPDLTERLSLFEGPTDWADNYGTRILGQLWPTASGMHTFWIASDDYSELWLSTTPQASNAVRVAWVSGSTGSRQWNRYTSQQSQPISLVAGNRYYIMALHKEGVGGDHVAVAWQGPTCPTRDVIDGYWLRPVPANEWPVFATRELPVVLAAEGIALNATIAGHASDPDGNTLTYAKRSGPNWLRVTPNGQLSGMPRDGDAGLNSFLVEVQDGRGGTDLSTLFVEVRDLHTGSKGLDDVLPFAAYWLSDGSSNPSDLTGSGLANYADWTLFSRNWQQDIVEGLVAHWKMDDAAGLTVRDYYGPHDGTMVNMSAYARTSGRLGGALYFDGVDDYVDIPGFKGISGGASRTCSAWIKTTTTASDILCWGEDYSGGRWSIQIGDDGELRVAILGGNIAGTTKVNDGAWHHIAVVLEDDVNSQISNAILYVDGRREIQTTSVTHAVNTGSFYNVRIGSLYSGHRYYRGIIDEVRVYNRALDAQEIESHAREVPLTHWKMNEGFGTEIFDAVSGYHGTLVNMGSASWVQGVEGYALHFDGVDDYVDIPGFKGISGGASRTCSAWVKTATSASDIVSWGEDYSGGRWSIQIGDGGELRVAILGGNIAGTTKINDGAWHHIAVVLQDDGNSQISNAVLYVDGRRENQTTSLNHAVDTGSFHNVRIGSLYSGHRYYNGSIDDVRIYDWAMDAESILELSR